MKTALTKTTILASLLVVASAWMISCSGDAGKDGKDGADGAPGAPGTGGLACTILGQTVTCGDQSVTVPSDGGSGSCTVTSGVLDADNDPAVAITCNGQTTYIKQGLSSANGCRLEVSADTLTTGLPDPSERDRFQLVCAGNSPTTLGLCDVNVGTSATPVYVNKFYDYKTEQCDSHQIIKGTGICAGTTYFLGEKFCQDGVTLLALCKDNNDGLQTYITARDSLDGKYSAREFCWNQTKVGNDFVPKTGLIKRKCGLSSAAVAALKTFEVNEFCQVVNFNATGEKQEVKTLCEYNTETKVGREFGLNQFCQTIPASLTYPYGTKVELLCGGEEFTYLQTCLPEAEVGGLCNDRTEPYNLKKAFCAEQDDQVYAFCGITATNTGLFNPTTSFCYSDDFGSSRTELANASGIIMPLCNDVKDITPANATTGAPADTTWAKYGYNTNHFCSDQNGRVNHKCGTGSKYNTNLYRCTDSTSTPNVLTGKCTDGNTSTDYDANKYVCATNKVYPSCGGFEGRAYDGDGATLTSYTGGGNTQICTSGDITCKNSGQITKAGVVGCVCPEANKPYWNAAATTPACEACPSTAANWNPQTAFGRGACTATCPSGSAADTNDNNICKCAAGKTWQAANAADVANAALTDVTAVGYMFCK